MNIQDYVRKTFDKKYHKDIIKEVQYREKDGQKVTEYIVRNIYRRLDKQNYNAEKNHN